jgi:hypothetical protein
MYIPALQVERFEVLTAVQPLQIQPMFRENISPPSSGSALLVICFHSGLLLTLFLDPEDGTCTFLRNFGWLSIGYTALYPERGNN